MVEYHKFRIALECGNLLDIMKTAQKVFSKFRDRPAVIAWYNPPSQIYKKS